MPDHFAAQPERHAEKGPDGGMAGWLAHRRRVMLDIVRDIRAAFCDRDPEDAGGNGHTSEALVKFGIGRNEPLYRDDVHVDVILVEEIDKTHLRLRER
jgi:hypothetical protein